MTRRSSSLVRTPGRALLLVALAAGLGGCGASGARGGAPESGVRGSEDADGEIEAAADGSTAPDVIDRAELEDASYGDGGGDGDGGDVADVAEPEVADGGVDLPVDGGVELTADASVTPDGRDDRPSDSDDASSETAPDAGGTPDPVTRGSYLVRAVLACGHCHAPEPGAAASQLLAGRDCFATVQIFGGPTTCLGAPNLTPDATGIGRYSDAQLKAMIFDGVRPDGVPLLAGYMPAYQFRLLSDDDAAAVVAYLRALPPVAHPVARRDPGVLAGVAAPLSWAELPPAGPAGERGRYLAGVACVACHSPCARPTDTRPIDVRGAFSGGELHAGLGRHIIAPNLRAAHPDGPGAHADSIVRALRTGLGRDGQRLGSHASGDPDGAYAQLSDGDRRAIAEYLASLPHSETIAARACDAP